MRELTSWIGLGVMLAVCGAALRWGFARERATAALVAAGWIGLLAAEVLLNEAAPWAVIGAMDVLVFALLLAITWRRTPDWAILALGFQSIALAVHAVRAFPPRMPTWTYMTALAVASYGVLLALAWGTWAARRRRIGGIHS